MVKAVIIYIPGGTRIGNVTKRVLLLAEDENITNLNIPYKFYTTKKEAETCMIQTAEVKRGHHKNLYDIYDHYGTFCPKRERIKNKYRFSEYSTQA